MEREEERRREIEQQLVNGCEVEISSCHQCVYAKAITKTSGGILNRYRSNCKKQMGLFCS